MSPRDGERVGQLDAQRKATSSPDELSLDPKCLWVLGRDAIEDDVRSRAQYEARRGFATVTALSRGPPTHHRKGKEAPFSLSIPMD